MTDESKNHFDAWVSSLTLIGSIIAFIFTLCTWQGQNKIKRADFLETKIKEFEDSSILLARSVLDSFAVCDTTNVVATSMSAQAMISIGSSRKKDTADKNPDIELKNIGKALNISLPDTSISRQKIRLSFDKLLDFFSKLDYYLNLDLITEKEIEYFTFYVKQCAENNQIMKYADRYNFNGFLSLVNKLKLSKTE